MPGDFKGTVFQEIWMGGGGLLAKDETVYKLNFLVIFKQMLFTAYMENTHNGEKLRKIKHISVNNGPPSKNCRSFLALTDGLG